MFKKVLIRNGLIVAALLGVVFLSQQSYFQGISKTFKFPLLEKTSGFLNNSPVNKVSDLFQASTYSNVGDTISQEAANRGEALKSEIKDQKEIIEEKSAGTVKKFLAEKFLQLLGVKPEDLTNSESASCSK